MQKWVLAEDVGITTAGKVFTPLLKKGTVIPCSEKQVFSTAEDNQTAVTIELVQGGGTTASKTRLLGKFDLKGIPSAPKAVPQIEVCFDIDDAGNLSVEAKDLGSLSKQELKVEASAEHRVKLTAANETLAEDVSFTISGGPAETIFTTGLVLPVTAPLIVTQTEIDQELFPIAFLNSAKETIAKTTLRLKGVKGPVGGKLAVNMELSVDKEGQLQLHRHDSDGNPGDLLLKSDGKLAVNKGQPDNADPFNDLFRDIFGRVPGSKEKTGARSRMSSSTQRAATPPSAGRIFISHASQDAKLANELREQLEGPAKQRCWIAPRDVRSGYDYRSEIVEGIKSCGHFIVLLSETSNASSHVRREVSLADQYSKRIIVVRLEHVVLHSELEYTFQGLHWVTWQDVQDSIDRLL